MADLVYHVTPVDNLWKVGIPGDSQPISFHQSKREAVGRAVQLARQDPQGRVVILTADGVVEEEYAIGGAERSSG